MNNEESLISIVFRDNTTHILTILVVEMLMAQYRTQTHREVHDQLASQPTTSDCGR